MANNSKNYHKKRIKQLQDQLNEERDKRRAQAIRVRQTLDAAGRQLQAESERYMKLQAQHDDLVIKYDELLREVNGDERGPDVPEQEALPDEEVGEVRASEDVEEG